MKTTNKRTIGIHIRFNTNKLGKRGHAWSGGWLEIEGNERHDIKPSKRVIPFRNLDHLVIRLAENGIVLHNNTWGIPPAWLTNHVAKRSNGWATRT